jgi:hypothetical protein
MANITHTVWDFLHKDPSIKENLSKDIINVRALANYIIKKHPWIQKEHKYFNTQTSTPWVKVNYVAEHVLFNHQRHINKNLSCQECHGQVQNLHRLPHKNWHMNECITCHFKRNVNVDCWLACHS